MLKSVGSTTVNPFENLVYNVRVTEFHLDGYLLGLLPLTIFFLAVLVLELVVGVSLNLSFDNFL